MFVKENFGVITRFVLTLVLLGLTIWWLAVVASLLGVGPTNDKAGKLLFDPFQRSKDILLAVMPLPTVALGYWFGAAGKQEAEKKADKAEQKLQSVLDTSDTPGLLDNAKQRYPEAFER